MAACRRQQSHSGAPVVYALCFTAAAPTYRYQAIIIFITSRFIYIAAFTATSTYRHILLEGQGLIIFSGAGAYIRIKLLPLPLIRHYAFNSHFEKSPRKVLSLLLFSVRHGISLRDICYAAGDRPIFSIIGVDSFANSFILFSVIKLLYLYFDVVVSFSLSPLLRRDGPGMTPASYTEYHGKALL